MDQFGIFSFFMNKHLFVDKFLLVRFRQIISAFYPVDQFYFCLPLKEVQHFFSSFMNKHIFVDHFLHVWFSPDINAIYSVDQFDFCLALNESKLKKALKVPNWFSSLKSKHIFVDQFLLLRFILIISTNHLVDQFYFCLAWEESKLKDALKFHFRDFGPFFHFFMCLGLTILDQFFHMI